MVLISLNGYLDRYGSKFTNFQLKWLVLDYTTVVPLTGQVANIWKNTQKMVLDGSEIHNQKMVKKWFWVGQKYILKKWSKNGCGLSGRVCHRHTQKIMLK